MMQPREPQEQRLPGLKVTVKCPAYTVTVSNTFPHGSADTAIDTAREVARHLAALNRQDHTLSYTVTEHYYGK